MSQTLAADTPRERFREMMRADILKAGRTLIRTGGFGALSMRALADAVGVRAPTLYDYFENKDDVLNALFMQGIDEARHYFDRMSASAPAGAARVIGIGLGYCDFAKDHPELFQLLFTRIDPNYIPGEAQMDAGQSLFVEFRNEVARAIEVGDLQAANIEQLTLILWAGVHGIVSLESCGFQDKCLSGSPADMAATMVGSLMTGVLRRDVDDVRPISCPIPSEHALASAIR
jgi:AcrR family transcriptional regulator